MKVQRRDGTEEWLRGVKANLARKALDQPSPEAVRALSNTFLTGEA